MIRLRRGWGQGLLGLADGALLPVGHLCGICCLFSSLMMAGISCLDSEDQSWLMHPVRGASCFWAWRAQVQAQYCGFSRAFCLILPTVLLFAQPLLQALFLFPSECPLLSTLTYVSNLGPRFKESITQPLLVPSPE